MMRYFILLAASILMQTAKADTIDFWHVYYNKSKILEANQNLNPNATFKKGDIKQTDSITVYYYDDTPCSNCNVYLSVEDHKHHVIANTSAKGMGKRLTFSVWDLAEFARNTGKDDFIIYFMEGEIRSPSQKRFVMTIRLE